MPRWRQDRVTGKLVLIETGPRKSVGPVVRSDSGSFVSPIDGSIVNGNAGLREHEKRTGQTSDLDSLREHSARAGERPKLTERDKRQRKDQIANAMERAQSSGFHRHVQYED